MNDNDETLGVCMRCDDHEQPIYGSRLDYCVRCNHPVWRGPAMPDDVIVACWECAAALTMGRTDVQAQLVLTPEQEPQFSGEADRLERLVLDMMKRGQKPQMRRNP